MESIVILKIIVSLVGIASIGYLTLHFFRKGEMPLERARAGALFISLPFCLTTGLAVSTVLFMGLATFQLDLSIVVSVYICSFVTLLFLQRKSIGKLFRTTNRQLPKLTAEDVVPLLLIVSSFAFFITIATSLGWSPPGDPVSHGFLSSLILYNKKFPSNFSPISTTTPPIPIFLSYSPGFSVTTAVLSLLLNQPPGISMLILAAIVTSIIPGLVYSITYSVTGSKVWSFVSFLLVFLIPGGEFKWAVSRDLLMFNLLNGTYPNILGIALTIGFFYMLIGFHTLSWKKLIPVILIYGMAIFITYPLFLWAYALALLLRFMLTEGGLLKNRTLLTEIGICFISLFLAFAIFHDSEMVQTLFSAVSIQSKYLSGYWLDPLSYMLESTENFAIIVVASILSIVALKKKISYLSLLCASLACVFLFAAYKPFYKYLWFLGMDRTINILVAVSIVALCVTLHRITSRIHVKLPFNNLDSAHIFEIPRTVSLSKVLSMAIVLMMVFNIGSWIYNMGPPKTWGIPSEADLNAFNWIAENVPVNELVVNDRSWQGLYLTSFVMHNVSAVRWGISQINSTVSLYRDTFLIYDNPYNYSLIRDMILKWRIKYIYVSDDSAYPLFPWISDENIGTYGWRQYSAGDYIEFFDRNPYLIPLFREGNIGVYGSFLLFSNGQISKISNGTIAFIDFSNLNQATEISFNYTSSSPETAGLNSEQRYWWLQSSSEGLNYFEFLFNINQSTTRDIRASFYVYHESVNYLGNVYLYSSADGKAWSLADSAVSGAGNTTLSAYLPNSLGQIWLKIRGETVTGIKFSYECVKIYYGIFLQNAGKISIRGISGTGYIDILDIHGNATVNRTYFSQLSSPDIVNIPWINPPGNLIIKIYDENYHPKFVSQPLDIVEGDEFQFQAVNFSK